MTAIQAEGVAERAAAMRDEAGERHRNVLDIFAAERERLTEERLAAKASLDVTLAAIDEAESRRMAGFDAAREANRADFAAAQARHDAERERLNVEEAKARALAQAARDEAHAVSARRLAEAERYGAAIAGFFAAGAKTVEG